MESSKEKEVRNKEIFIRIRTSKSIDKKIFQTYHSSLILLPRQTDPKLWENEEKIIHIFNSNMKVDPSVRLGKLPRLYCFFSITASFTHLASLSY